MKPAKKYKTHQVNKVESSYRNPATKNVAIDLSS